MNQALALELFGYLGSFLVLISMLMTSVVRLRVINLIGSAIFAAYAILIRSYPTALLNGCLVLINLYHLLRLRRSSGSSYEIQALGAGEGFAAWFLRKFGDDIKQYFPALNIEQAKNAEGFAVFYQSQAAGILLGKRTGNEFQILLDYTTPAYRDCSVGEYLYSELPSFGISRLSCIADNPEHIQYMEKMGFTMQENQKYVKELAAQAHK